MSRADPNLEALLERNRNWASDVTESNPGYFDGLRQQQVPKYLWIGCSDSRVPDDQITGCLPGECFVHRNIANVVVHSDLNCMSVIQFAIDVLRIRSIIVCGHYECAGVKAAMFDQHLGLVDNWLRHVLDVRNRNREELRTFKDDSARMARLCELNALAQAINVGESTVMRDAWARDLQVSVHALIYGPENGILENLGLNLASPAQVQLRKSELGW